MIRYVKLHSSRREVFLWTVGIVVSASSSGVARFYFRRKEGVVAAGIGIVSSYKLNGNDSDVLPVLTVLR